MANPFDPCVTRQPVADHQCKVVIDRAGVGLFVLNAQLREHVEDSAGLYLELSGQLVDADLTHSLDRNASTLADRQDRKSKGDCLWWRHCP